MRDEGLLEQASVPTFLSRDDLRLGPIVPVVRVDGVFCQGRLFSLLESSPQAVSYLPDVGPVTVDAGDFINDSKEFFIFYGVFLAAKDRTKFIKRFITNTKIILT